MSAVVNLVFTWVHLNVLRLCVTAIVGLAGPAYAQDRAPLNLFAAASLGEVLKAATQTYASPVRISVGGSGTIARQVDQGAPADVVMLANPVWMDWLDTRGLLVPNTRVSPVGNALVLVGPPGSGLLSEITAEHIRARLGTSGRLAVGEHRSVPVGQYSKLWLENKGLWGDVKPKLAEVDNVRGALALAARGEVPLAIVYASDLVAAPDSVSVVWNIPPEQQPEIKYALAAVTPEGRALVAHLITPATLETFRAFGFKTGRD